MKDELATANRKIEAMDGKLASIDQAEYKEMRERIGRYQTYFNTMSAFLVLFAAVAETID